MHIVIIGTGNTATVLGKRIKAAGHNIVLVFGRNESEAKTLAAILGTTYTSSWNDINNTNAELYLLAVTDDALEDISQQLSVNDKILVHTAGAVSKDVLKNASRHYGVLYPLQSLRKEMEPLTEIPLHIDASDEQTLKLIGDFANSISKHVTVSNDMERLKLHVAAVFCNNFTNYMYTLAEEYCKKENLAFNHLIPLIKETASKLQYHSPSSMQTGPAIRGDKKTIQKHEQLLAGYEELHEVYQNLTQKISEH
ncbi:MAG: DUF2520 domain-containing protein [Chitinophagaceae bacterium]|jgi:predicted short-subunit dehydrogenase-like oxidoreductase (DUF2520 family)|nr:DUF2520 domain-containing protein [Chitinophagaceae bacterium]